MNAIKRIVAQGPASAPPLLQVPPNSADGIIDGCEMYVMRITIALGR